MPRKPCLMQLLRLAAQSILAGSFAARYTPGLRCWSEPWILDVCFTAEFARRAALSTAERLELQRLDRYLQIFL